VVIEVELSKQPTTGDPNTLQLSPMSFDDPLATLGILVQCRCNRPRQSLSPELTYLIYDLPLYKADLVIEVVLFKQPTTGEPITLQLSAMNFGAGPLATLGVLTQCRCLCSGPHQSLSPELTYLIYDLPLYRAGGIGYIYEIVAAFSGSLNELARSLYCTRQS